ncbi:MAG: glutathione S-transferase family protein [Bdellovibrionota bacterium]
MANTLQFYTNPMSRGRIAHWMLEEIGVPYETHLLNMKRGEHKSAEYLKINPMGKVPTLVHNGVVITEAAAICAYLADAFPQAKLAPATASPERGTYLRWFFFSSGPVEAALTDKTNPRATEARASMLSYGTYADTLDTLEKALTPGPFVLGEQFTAVDLYIASQIGYGLMVKSLEARPVFLEYLQRCASRPGYERANAKFKELEDTLAAKT